MLKWPETYGKSKPLDVGASSMTDASSKSIWQRSVEKLRSRDRLPSADFWEAGVGRNVWLRDEDAVTERQLCTCTLIIAAIVISSCQSPICLKILFYFIVHQ